MIAVQLYGAIFMKKYKRVLLALELDNETDAKVIKKAKEISELFDAKLWVVHSVEHLNNYGAAYGIAAGVDIDAVLKTEAKKAMDKVAKELGLPDEQMVIIEGPAKHVILEEAEKIKADLIICGSHGRHGVRLLLGSTANSILHGAQCDVLAVRVED